MVMAFVQKAMTGLVECGDEDGSDIYIHAHIYIYEREREREII